MKKAFLITLFALTGLMSFGQKIRFTDSANIWKLYDISFGGSITGTGYASTYYILADTTSLIIGSDKYRRVDMSYVREDTTLNKVYIRYYNHSLSFLDTADQLLYDYNWHIADTVRYYQIGYDTTTYWITAIDSTRINGLWYKVWHFESAIIYYNVIEGIGCTNGFDYPINPYPPFEFSAQLICFSNRESTYPLSNPISSWGILGDIYLNNTTSCDIPPLGIKEITKNTTYVFPNPLDNTSKITLPYNISGNLVVFNSIGQVVINTPVLNKIEILIGNKIEMPGIYHYRVMDEQNGEVFSGKFVY